MCIYLVNNMAMGQTLALDTLSHRWLRHVTGAPCRIVHLHGDRKVLVIHDWLRG